jgi:hypothetical protein
MTNSDQQNTPRPDFLLTSTEIQLLSGYRAHRCQIRWLRQNNIKFLVDGSGRPRVLRAAIELQLGVSELCSESADSSTKKPNFGPLRLNIKVPPYSSKSANARAKLRAN